MPQRLDRILSECTTYTRSELKRMILRGEITVDGEAARRPEQKVDPDRQEIALLGRPIACGHSYLMMNKPAGFVSATDDPRQKTVLELVPPELRRKSLFPAGRLDKDTEGFLLLTDDGDFAHRILSPKNHVAKTYFARVEGELCADAAARFGARVTLEDGALCRPAKLEALSPQNGEYRVVLHEGMYHQVKRMFLACGAQVVYLKREAIGELPLDGSLPLGGCRPLDAGELEKIASNGFIKPKSLKNV